MNAQGNLSRQNTIAQALTFKFCIKITTPIFCKSMV